MFPLSAATAFFDRSVFWSDPLMTCAEPMLFIGTSTAAAAYAELPPSVRNRASNSATWCRRR
jgi:hypothetical protein